MEASTTSIQSSSTKEFKIGADYCGWLDPVEVGPGWRKGDWGCDFEGLCLSPFSASWLLEVSNLPGHMLLPHHSQKQESQAP